MTPDYLTLTDGRKVRIELDWDVYANWSTLTGADLQGLANLKSDLNLLKTLAWCGASEGEHIEGKELGLSEEEFGRLCRLQTMVEFITILSKQTPAAEKKNSGPNKSK